MTNESNDSGSGFFAGLFVGGVLGLAAGIVLAPKSGDEMRTMITERGQEWRDKADDLAAAARERLAAASSEGRRAASTIRGDSPFDELDLDDEDR
jgi:gas vesicle protein